MTTSIILSSNKIQNGDILVPANPGPRGKMAIKINGERERERENERMRERMRQLISVCEWSSIEYEFVCV